MSRRWNLVAFSILTCVFIGMSIYLILNPSRTGVVPNYRMAAAHWWLGEPIYGQGTGGFLYYPQFIVFFSPFHWIRPELMGEIVWRAFGFGLFTLALHSLSAVSLRPSTLLVLVALSVPASLASLNNGQTNLPLSACLVLSVLSLRNQKWGWAALFLTLSLILKPIALALWLLAFAGIPRVRRPLLIGLAAFFVFGFAHFDFYYACDRWLKCLEKIVRSYNPENLRVSDIFSAVAKTGWTLPALLVSGTRAVACLVALAYVWQAFRRQGLTGASWALWVATALVLTIFNPRAETNSYVLISPLLAFAAVNYWQEGAGDKWKGWVLAAACIGLMCDGMGLWIYKATDVWFKPFIVLLVSPLLFRMPDSWKIKSRESN